MVSQWIMLLKMVKIYLFQWYLKYMIEMYGLLANYYYLKLC